MQDTRNQEVSNLKGPSVEQDIAFARAPHNRPSVIIPHACVSSDANHSSKPVLSVSAYAYRRVDSRATSLGGISIFCGRMERFDPILAIRSSAAMIPILQVPWSIVVSGTASTSE
jgi:hypothetical protein